MAGRIPQSFIDEVLTRTDIVDVIDARVQLKKAGREYTACCPFHNEKTPSFTVSPNKQFYHCFGCGAHGSAIGFVMEYDHLNFPEAVEELARLNGMEVPREAGPAPDPKVKQHQTSLYDLVGQCDRFYRQQLRQHPQAKRAVEYLKQRGLSGEIAAVFGIGYAPPGWESLLGALESNDKKELEKKLIEAGMLIQKDEGGSYDRFRDRIMFPIRDQRGRAIAFGGRILGDEKPKYLNSPETPLFHKGRELYGLFEMKQAMRKIERILVVEGYMDVVALAQFHIRYAVATLGTATTPDHLHKLFRICPEVIFCFDGDRAGRDAAWRALENALPILKEGNELRFLFLPDGEDPDTLIRKEGKQGFETRLDEADTLSQYFFNQLADSVDMRSLDGRARLIELARPHLTKLPHGLFRHMMVSQLASLTKVEPEIIESRFRATKKPTGSNEQPQQPAFRAPKKSNLAQQAQLTPMRRVIAYLLHNPQLALQVEPDTLAHLQLPGMPLLMQLLEMIRQEPQITTAILHERWRNTEQWPHLAKLLALDIVQEGIDLETEFQAVIQALLNTSNEQRLDYLLAKADQGPLNSAEKEELQQLLSRSGS